MKIYIDGSHTFCTSRNTGIERVVRMLSDHLKKRQTGNKLSVQRIIHHESNFMKLDDDFYAALQRLHKFEQNPNVYLPKVARWGIQTATSWRPLKSLRKILLPEPSHLGIYKLPYKLITRATVKKWAHQQNRINWCKGDILIMPDAYWTKREIWPAVQQAKEAGATVVSIFYDLIPITHPEFVAMSRTEKFSNYVEELVKNSDLILAISKTVRDELRNYVKESLGETNLNPENIAYFKLGADFNTPKGTVRQKVIDYFNTDSPEHRPYIVVGSLDPRKNHVQAIEAFEILKKRNMKRRLCFIGRAVGDSEALTNRMADSDLGPELLVNFRDLSDAELHYAYRNAQAVIMPSKIEGFGLPIVEALWHGACVLASDIAVHREVGGDNCIYFPLDSPAALAEKVLLHESSEVKNAGEKIQPTSWDESAAQVLDHCNFIARQKLLAQTAV